MIRSKKDYKFYLEADRIAKAIPKKGSLFLLIRNIIFPNYVWRFQKTLRKLEYYENCKKGIVSFVVRLFLTKKYFNLSVKLGFSIPTNVFGPGLSIAHRGTIIVSRGAKIGANCRLHACVNIGTKAGADELAPTIGDDCYIGPGVKMYGEISIPNGTAIGANAVVNTSFDEENITIAGVPARRKGKVDTFDFIIPATRIIESGYDDALDLKGLTGIKLREKLSCRPLSMDE